MKWLPKPHVLDVRSLALFRILLGFSQLYDVYDRTRCGKYDLAWYLSDPPEHSYHTTKVEDSWAFGLPSIFPFIFTRHTIEIETAHFVIYAILAFFLFIGFKTRWVLPCMWLLSHAHQSKARALTDGSDLLLQQLILCSCLLPCSQVWSVDAMLARRNNTGTFGTRIYPNNQVRSIACLCITTQMVMMYLGCVLDRTLDTYTLTELIQGGVSDWLWPHYSLVHYASNGSGVYKSFVSDIIRNTPTLNKFMTFSGFLIELICPLLCFFFNQRYSHWGALHLFLLHLGIGQILNIPQWMQLGCFMQVVWIPTHVWDRLLKTDPEKIHDKKKIQDSSSVQRPIDVLNETSNVIALFMLYLLVMTWGNSRGWVAEKYDVSDFALNHGFFNSNWYMWHNAPRSSPFTMILGWRPRELSSSQVDKKDAWESLNLYRFMKFREEVIFTGFTDDLLEVFTHEYPSPRWEKGIGDEWETNLKTVIKPMGNALCTMINEELSRAGRPEIILVQFAVHTRYIKLPRSKKRFAAPQRKSTYRRNVFCKPLSGPLSIPQKIKDRGMGVFGETDDDDDDDDDEEEDEDDEDDDEDEEDDDDDV